MSEVAKITNLEDDNNILKFTLSNINVSYANAIRRIILSEIPCLVFKTQPYSENKVKIIINKTRLNNELIKQRISCIPVHISDLGNFPFEDYIVELNVKNDTDTIMYATTEDFKIKNINTQKYLESAEVKQIFPPDPITGDYIDIIRLRPKFSENFDPEQLKLEALLSIGNAEEDGMFNVVSTCSYGNTLDPIKIKETWEQKEEELKLKEYSKEDIEFMKKDWLLLDAKRLFIEDSFDFVIESIGIYNNFKIVELGCSILIKKLYSYIELLKSNDNLIQDAIDTLENCYLIVLENEDYSIGKIIEFYLYKKYFIDEKKLNYVGFLKKHPHNQDSFIKLSFKDIISKDEIIIIIEDCVNNSILLINSIKEYFNTD
tara:strand:- start:540 stop:1661 length:1122 start_codon:yes stop_codon:yes gene_type:complete